MTDESSVAAVTEFFTSTVRPPAAEEKNSDPAPSQPDDAGKPEERAETHSEGDDEGLPDIIEEEESSVDDEGESEAQETNEAEETEEVSAEAKAFEIPLPDGTVKKVTAEEFNSSYVPKAEFTRKTQELAEQKKVFDQEAENTRQQTQSVLQQLVGFYQSEANPIHQLARQYNEAIEIGDEITALRLKDAIRDEKEKQESVQNAYAYEMAKSEQKRKEDNASYIAEQARSLREKLPFLSKPEGKEKFDKAISKAMAKVGFSEAELNGMERPDHRNAMLAYFAGKYLEGLEAKPAVAQALKGKAVSPTPGARRAGSGNKSDVALQSFVKNPTADGLAAWFNTSSSRR